MTDENLDERQQRLARFKQNLEAVRQFQQDKLKYGLDAAYLYFEDVDGDWLETWGDDDDDDQPSYLELWTNFLESDDQVAVRVRQHLHDKSTLEIIEQLENCLSLYTEKDRLLGLKDVLAGGVTVSTNNRDSSDNEIDEIELLDLAEDLLEKLKEIYS